MSEEMDCQRYLDLMTEYIEGDLNSRDRALWEKHFKDCPRCADFFKSFSSSLHLIRYLSSQPCPSEVKVRLQRVIDDHLGTMP